MSDAEASLSGVETGGELHGVVTAFDEHRGLGEVRADGGGVAGFHCTQIADGSRSIAVGARVRYRLRPWHAGRFEAVGLVAEPG